MQISSGEGISFHFRESTYVYFCNKCIAKMRDVCMHKWLEMVLDGIIIQGASKMGLPMVSLR